MSWNNLHPGLVMILFVDNHDAYLQQVVEAFSFSFEKDCSKAAEELWSYIDFS